MGTIDFSDTLAVALVVAVPLLALHSIAGLIFRGRAVRNWEAVDGYVEYIHDYAITGGRGWRYVIGTGIEIEYRYSYGGIAFESTRVSVVDFPPRLWVTEYRDLVPGLKAAYKERKPIQVFVNPRRPHQAVLTIPSIKSQVHRSLAAILVASLILPSLFLQDMAGVVWSYGIVLGILIYALFFAGILSTAF